MTIIGEIASKNILTRNNARAGDRIFVSGNIGSAALGLHILQYYGTEFPPEFNHFVAAHLQPVPRIEAGKELSSAGIVTAMIDLSDGLSSDLRQICTMSNAGAEIYEAKLPLPQDNNKLKNIDYGTLLKLALHGGEDYELLFTVTSSTAPSILENITTKTGVRLTEIGKILPPEQGFNLINKNGNRTILKPGGWNHFTA